MSEVFNFNFIWYCDIDEIQKQFKKKTQPLGIKLSAKEDSMTGEVGCTVQPPMRKYKLTFRKEGSSLHFCKVMQISPMNHTE